MQTMDLLMIILPMLAVLFGIFWGQASEVKWLWARLSASEIALRAEIVGLRSELHTLRMSAYDHDLASRKR